MFRYSILPEVNLENWRYCWSQELWDFVNGIVREDGRNVERGEEEESGRGFK
jgi:hypothetical protein